MKIKFIIIFFIGLFIVNVTTEAAKIDIYKNAILNKRFTIKYAITMPPARNSSKDGIFMMKHDLSILNMLFKDFTMLDTSSINGFNMNISSGIIVENGNDKYVEINQPEHEIVTNNFRGYNNVNNIHINNNTNNQISTKKVKANGICKLIKDDNVYNFIWKLKNGEKKYAVRKYKSLLEMFDKKEKIKANDNNSSKGYSLTQSPYDKLIEEYNYGNATLLQAIAPILPKDRIIKLPNTVDYRFVASGSLGNGLTYEDFTGSNKNIFQAVRYYFNGNKMVKIANFNYFKNETGIKSFEKSIIDITEFSTEPDMTYLSLPDNFVDITEQNEEEKTK